MHYFFVKRYQYISTINSILTHNTIAAVQTKQMYSGVTSKKWQISQLELTGHRSRTFISLCSLFPYLKPLPFAWPGVYS